MARARVFAVLRNLLSATLAILDRAEHDVHESSDEEFELVDALPENQNDNVVRHVEATEPTVSTHSGRNNSDLETRLRYARAQGAFARSKLEDPQAAFHSELSPRVPDHKF